MSRLSPQAKIVLDHLIKVGHISNVEANAVLKVRSVSRRITEIIDAGYYILKDFKKDSTGQRYVKYTLASPVPYMPASMFGYNPTNDAVSTENL